MLLYIVLTIAVITAAFFVNNRISGYAGVLTRERMVSMVSLGLILTLLFLMAAFRINVGNDYTEYVRIFQNLTLDRQVSSEFGFNAVVRVFQAFFGSGTYLPIFAFFSAVTIGFMIKAIYDQCDWFWYGLALFLFCGYYFSSLNTVRYYVAFSIALFAAKYVIRKDYIRFLLWILLAATVHKTVLFVIPVYWFAARAWKKREVLAVLGLCAALLAFPQFFRKIIFMIYPYYENSAFDTGGISWINMAKCACVLLFALIYYKTAVADSRQNLFYFYCNLGAVLLYTFGSFIPEVSRLGYYLVGFQPILLANILKRISSRKQKLFFAAIIGFAFLAYFTVFLMRASGVELKIVPYQTWFFHRLEV